MNENKVRDQINEYLEQYTKLWAFSGSIAAMKDGEILFSNAYGYASIEHKVKNMALTKHRIWSITKQFTAAAILLLEEKGLLKVEDSIRKHFPEWVDLDERITIHHLLTHTSGIFNYTNLPQSHKTFYRMHHEASELIKLFTSKPLEFEPGTQWSYSNSGYYLLGKLIERLSGKTYHDFLMENIFMPLGMVNTGVEDEKKILEHKAMGYYLDGNELIQCGYVNMNLIYASGGMYSTTEDLLLWGNALNSEKLLTRASLEKMNTPYMNNYGYGVAINMNGSRRVVQHNGGCEGFLSEIHRYVDNDFTVVVLSNYGFTAVGKLCKTIAAFAFDEKVEMSAKPEAFILNDDILESYLGIYEEPGIKLEVKKVKDEIFLIINDEVTLPIYPVQENVFHHTWIDEEYAITKDEKGQLSLWGVKKVQ